MDAVQLVSIAGAILILGAYLGVQMKFLTAGRHLFTVLNLVGALLLALVAVIEEQVGFILLEGAWAAISAAVLAQLLLKPPSAESS